jgi:eukaryotic-like serine/threonine-protein kinase
VTGFKRFAWSAAVGKRHLAFNLGTWSLYDSLATFPFSVFTFWAGSARLLSVGHITYPPSSLGLSSGWGYISVEEAVHSSYLVRFESFEVNLRSGELHRNGEKINLPEQPFRILVMLLERPGQVVLRHEIQKNLWQNDTVVEFESSINSAIKKLRLALGDSAEKPRYIETLARRGYRWIVPVEWTEATPGKLQVPAATSPPQPPPSAPYLIGKRVSHYRVLEIIGGGGMGVVYKAEDIKLGRRVALKFLPEELVNDTAAMERFEREARAASALNHPNICTIYEVEEHDGQPFIVMELLEGTTVRELIAATEPPSSEIGSRKRSLTLETTVNIARQIVEGLEAAHGKGIIHRDVKPANISVTKQGQAKILDFVLAKLEEAEVSSGASSPNAGRPTAGANVNLTLTGAAMGTAGYMSPEQVRGEKVDARTDLFSFGLVLYEMAGGKQAFTGGTVPALHAAILERQPTPIHDLNPEVSATLERIINKALEKDRERRYQSASEVRADLQWEEAGYRQTTKPRSRTGTPPGLSLRPPQLFLSRFHRHRWLILGCVTFALAAMVSMFVAPKFRRTSLGAADLVLISDFVNATGEPIFDGTLKQALSVKLAESPYFNLVPSSRNREILRLMNRSPDERIVPPISRELCKRAGAKVLVGGSVLTVGRKYVLDLLATNCATGAEVASEEINAFEKEEILNNLGKALPKLRRSLGNL